MGQGLGKGHSGESLWTIWYIGESLVLTLGYTLSSAAIKSCSSGRGIRLSTKLPVAVSVLQHFSRHLDVQKGKQKAGFSWEQSQKQHMPSLSHLWPHMIKIHERQWEICNSVNSLIPSNSKMLWNTVVNCSQAIYIDISLTSNTVQLQMILISDV